MNSNRNWKKSTIFVMCIWTARFCVHRTVAMKFASASADCKYEKKKMRVRKSHAIIVIMRLTKSISRKKKKKKRAAIPKHYVPNLPVLYGKYSKHLKPHGVYSLFGYNNITCQEWQKNTPFFFVSEFDRKFLSVRMRAHSFRVPRHVGKKKTKNTFFFFL